MNTTPGAGIKRHFDEVADQAPSAPSTLVSTARAAGDRHRRRQVVVGASAGAVALTLAIGLGATQPWSDDAAVPSVGPTHTAEPSDTRTTSTSDIDRAGASWQLLSQPSGGREVEQYDTMESLFAAAPLLVRGTVTKVELGPEIDDPQVDQPYRDLLLTITPSEAAGAGSAGIGPVIVQLGPFFGAESDEWVADMSTGTGSLIGDEAVWALRPREDAPTYRPLTSDSVFVRDGAALLTPLAVQTSISEEAKSTTWLQMLRLVGLAG